MNANLDTLTQLNIELMEALELCLYCVEDFCAKNHIPFKNPKLAKLLGKVTRLMDEIEPPPFCKSLKLSDEFLQRRKSDRDLTEPHLIL